MPLNQVCDFFGLSYEVQAVGRDIISEEQMWIIRIRSSSGLPSLNWPTFFGYYRDALRNAYNDYYAPPTPASPTSPGDNDQLAPPVDEPPQRYSDVTIHHSFYAISAGGADAILELLNLKQHESATDYRFCFFISESDISEDADIVRKIAGSGYPIGIWLDAGTMEEYLRTSALLYEAAKVKTVLVSSFINDESIFEAEGIDEVIYWNSNYSIAYDDTFSVEAVTEMLPQESGERSNLIASCSDFTALMLVDILSYLVEREYIITGINETTPVLLSASHHLSDAND